MKFVGRVAVVVAINITLFFSYPTYPPTLLTREVHARFYFSFNTDTPTYSPLFGGVVVDVVVIKVVVDVRRLEAGVVTDVVFKNTDEGLGVNDVVGGDEEILVVTTTAVVNVVLTLLEVLDTTVGTVSLVVDAAVDVSAKLVVKVGIVDNREGNIVGFDVVGGVVRLGEIVGAVIVVGVVVVVVEAIVVVVEAAMDVCDVVSVIVCRIPLVVAVEVVMMFVLTGTNRGVEVVVVSKRVAGSLTFIVSDVVDGNKEAETVV